MDDIVVVDTSLAFKWIVVEDDTDLAEALNRYWISHGVQIAAPHLMLSEISNALHRAVVEDGLPVLDAASLIEQLAAHPLLFHHATTLYPRALALASELSQGAVYDSVFLALAEFLDCELWTADARFYRAASPRYDNVRLLTEFNTLA